MQSISAFPITRDNQQKHDSQFPGSRNLRLKWSQVGTHGWKPVSSGWRRYSIFTSKRWLDEENLAKRRGLSRRGLQARGEPGRRRSLEVMARSSAVVAMPTPTSTTLWLLLVVMYLCASCVEFSGATATGDIFSTNTELASSVSEGSISPVVTNDALNLPTADGSSTSLDVLGFQILPNDYSKPSPPDLISYDLAPPPHSPSRIPTNVSPAATSTFPVLSNTVSQSLPSFSLSPTYSNETSSPSAVYGNSTASPPVNATQRASKITHNDPPDFSTQPKITTFAPMDAPKSASEAPDADTPVTEDGDGVDSSDAEPYDLTFGPLSCSDVWPLLKKKDKGRCTYRWPDGAEYPEVLCELIGGYKPIAGSYTTLIHNAATYQVTSSRVGNASSPAAGWCAFQSRFEMRKVDTLPPGVPIRRDEALLQIAQSERGARGQEGETLLALVSQGFRAIRLDLRPDAIGAKGALLSDFHNCSSSTCKPEVWVIGYTKQVGVVDLYFNRAWRVFMEFNPAYMSLATFLLGFLREGAAVEELEVHGGERWEDAVVIPVPLLRLRALDFSRNGLAAFSEVNLQRVLNVQHLNLSYNNFEYIPKGVSLLLGLRTLDLSRNPLTTPQLLPVLRPLLQLRVLNLTGTLLQNLEPLAPRMIPFREPTEEERNLYPQLEILDVSSCNISDVASAGAHCILKKARRLHSFRLANNPIVSVPKDLVERLPSLQVLDLSGCLLTRPPALRLPAGVRLQRLDLSRNLLSSPAGALAGAGQEQDQGRGQGGGAALLDVSGNPLRGEWGAHAFAALGPRAAVNLSRTELTALSPPMLRALRSLRLVDLGGNPIDCAKCDIRHLQEWLRNGTGPPIVSLGASRPLECALPPPERGRAVADAPGPTSAQCAPPSSSWSGVAVAGAVVVGALLAAAAIAVLSLRFRLELTYVVHVLRANRSVKGAAATGTGVECDFDAFVCYSKHDRPWVLGELLPRLEGSNPRYRLCLHERDFPLGSLIVQNIVECMARSRRTIMILTPAFVGSQWCQWELEMATHRLLEGAGRDFLVLVELQPLDARALPRLLRLLVETRTFLQWPSGCAPGGCCGGGADGAEETAWRRLRAALGPPIKRASRHGPSTPGLPNSAPLPTLEAVLNDNVAVAIIKEKDPPLFGGDIPLKNSITLDV